LCRETPLRCQNGPFTFDGTDEWEDLADILGQQRALEAIRFTVRIRREAIISIRNPALFPATGDGGRKRHRRAKPHRRAPFPELLYGFRLAAYRLRFGCHNQRF
jgi:hypothetical protein